MENELFFIYGSFRDPNHLRGRIFQDFSGAKPLINNVYTEPTWDLKNVRDGDFPALIPGTFSILGNIFEVPTDVIAWMDQIENTEGGLYKRIKVNLNDQTQAWAYQLLDFSLVLDDTNIGIEQNTKHWRL